MKDSRKKIRQSIRESLLFLLSNRTTMNEVDSPPRKSPHWSNSHAQPKMCATKGREIRRGGVQVMQEISFYSFVKQRF